MSGAAGGCPGRRCISRGCRRRRYVSSSVTSDLNSVNQPIWPGEAAGDEAGQAANPSNWDKLSNIAKTLIKVGEKLAVLGALATAVYQVVQAAQAKNPTPENEALEAMCSNITTAIDLLRKVVQDWGQWMNNNVSNRSDFGTIVIQGVTVERFNLLNASVNTLMDDLNNNLSPVLKNLTDNPTIATATQVRVALVQLCSDTIDVSNDIKNNEPLMVAAGLKDNHVEINSALAAVSTSLSERRESRPLKYEDGMSGIYNELRTTIPRLRRPQDDNVLFDMVNNLSDTYNRLYPGDSGHAHPDRCGVLLHHHHVQCLHDGMDAGPRIGIGQIWLC